jgi:hypothetical protein
LLALELEAEVAVAPDVELGVAAGAVPVFVAGANGVPVDWINGIHEAVGDEIEEDVTVGG